VRVLLANEPRSYREVIAEVVRRLLSGVEAITVEQDELDDAIGRFAPDLIICSNVTATVMSSAPIWVDLYPGYGARAIVSVDGSREEFAEIQLADLLSLVHRADGSTR
jgi:hypothetical protein